MVVLQKIQNHAGLHVSGQVSCSCDDFLCSFKAVLLYVNGCIHSLILQQEQGLRPAMTGNQLGTPSLNLLELDYASLLQVISQA